MAVNPESSSEPMRIMKNNALARYDYLRFTFVDFHGITRSKTVPKARIKQFFNEGVSFFAGAIGMSLVGPMVPRETPDIKHTNSGNVLAHAQPNTLHPLPLNGGPCKMGEVLCETFFPNGSPQEANPRTMVRKQLTHLQRLGYQMMSSWEIEVTFLHENMDPIFQRSIMAFTNKAFDEIEEMLLYTDKVLSEMGIDVETIQAEASPGQYEFVFKPTRGIQAADSLVCVKDALRKIAKKYNKKAIFMTKIFPEPGYSAALHFNHSLWQGQRNLNLFYDYDASDKLSKVCRFWNAGLLKHAPALTALTCPTVNCYRRLHTAIAPERSDWGFDARLACLRIKNYSADSTYTEFRLPSGSANPYLVMAGTIAAGIDGLLHRYELPPPIGNYDLEKTKTAASAAANAEPNAKRIKVDHNTDNSNGDVAGDKLTSETIEVKLLPRTLEEALVALENDSCIVEALGERFVKWFVEIKRNEIKHFDSFKDIKMADMLQRERECYMDLL